MKGSFLAACALFGSFCAGAHAQVQMNKPDDFVTRDGNTTQSETNHAVTANGILAAWNDSSQLAMYGTMGVTSQVAWRYSRDGGRSFTDGDFFTLPGNRVCINDPAVVADSSGYFYLAAVASKPNPSTVMGEPVQNIVVARSTGNTPPFSFATAVIVDPAYRDGMLDKELMALDPIGNRIYITATDIASGNALVAHTESLSPVRFSPWKIVSTGCAPPTLCIPASGSMPAVGLNGEVYVIWTAGPNTLQVVKSIDGGGSFSKPRLVAMFRSLPFLTTSSGYVHVIHTEPFAQIAVDSTAAGSPTRGNVYVVIAARTKGSDNADVYFTRSTDGGVTWARLRSISSGLAATLGQDLTTNDNWMPSIAVSPVNGHIYVTFYDRRDDKCNVSTRVFRALSTDGGLTWASSPLSAPSFVPIVGFSQAGQSNSYWGEYNWTTADATGLHFTWGDSHLCKPPGKCDPPGRPDLDVYYHTVANLSGPDLFIQPWGAVTGIGPAWQSPDVFVVDKKGHVINPRMGKFNRLRARVRNLGTVGASGVVVRFRYAPELPGVDDSQLKDAGSVPLSFPAAGGLGDTQIAEIRWDLRSIHDTNGGRWPAEIGAFVQLRVKVSVEFAADINLSNNAAESNLDVVKKSDRPIRAPEPPGKFRGIGPVTARYWEVEAPPKPPDQPSTPGFQRPPPPPQVIPEGVKARRTYTAGYEMAFGAALASFKRKQEGPAVANRERGLINSHSERLTAEEIRKLVVAEDAQRVTGDGYAIVSLYFQPLADGRTEVGAAALIAVDEGESPLGTVLTSNGTLEASYLDAVTAGMPPP